METNENVVIDRNGYRIQNTAPGSRPKGMAINGSNHIVRNWDVRGFRTAQSSPRPDA